MPKIEHGYYEKAKDYMQVVKEAKAHNTKMKMPEAPKMQKQPVTPTRLFKDVVKK